MSPRAAWRLESLGFTNVYDFVAGKAAWSAAGLPMEGTEASKPRAGDIVRRDVLTCGLEDGIGVVLDAMERSGQDLCVVVNQERIVLGRLRRAKISGGPEVAVKSVMEPGPTTVRPDQLLGDLFPRMQRRGTQSVIVTSYDGKLVGLLHREDVERHLTG